LRNSPKTCASGLRSRQREILSKYLYDEVGSRSLKHCLLPEYGLTRADTRLLQRHAREMVARMPRPAHVAELGSGSAKKRAGFSKRSPATSTLLLSDRNLSRRARRLRKRTWPMDLVHIVGYEKPYFEGLRAVVNRREPGEHVCVLFSAAPSEISTVPPPTLFSARFAHSRTGRFPAPRHRSRKKYEVQLLAYDDPAGVTAAFNLNVLAASIANSAPTRLETVAHEALWNVAERASNASALLATPALDIPAPACAFASKKAKPSGRKVRTNILRPNHRNGGAHRLHCEAQWIDEEWLRQICGLSNKT